MSKHTVKIWDWPVRLTHWSFALLIPAMWWTAENGEMGWHMRLGLLLLALVLFRILWGLFGSDTARFAQFLRLPHTAFLHLIGRVKTDDKAIGHSPSGGWSVIALLAAMLAQASFGLFAGDPFDGATGPLNESVGVMTADTLTEWHETFFWWLVGLIALHLVAVALYHFIGRQNLVGPMVTGKRTFEGERPSMIAAPSWRLMACLAVSFGIVGAIWNGAVTALVS